MEKLSDNAINRLTQRDFLITGNELIRFAINKDFQKPILFLHFTYEMHPKKEQIRTGSTLTGFGYDYLHSAKWDSSINDYRTLSDEDLKIMNIVLRSFAESREHVIYMFPTAGNLIQMANTIEDYAINYPNHKIIVGIDHTHIEP